jgi:predicted RNA-binding protein with PIN domain
VDREGVRTLRARRRPTPLPPAVFEDSPEATLHLLRVPRMVLLVDGYNVSLEAWPGRPISEQRRRLVDALAGLSARTGAEAQVVFDGAEQVEPRAVGPPPRSPVRVRFSPPDVDADEVLIELIDVLPPARPVTVATSDRRVQDDARDRGANVISTAQLLAALTGR